MKDCPRCSSMAICKAGVVKGKQRFKCKSCSYFFSVSHIGKPDSKKRDALIFFLLGMDYRTIGKLLHINHATVFGWVKEYGKDFEKLRLSKVKAAQFGELKKAILDIENQEKQGVVIIDFSGEETNIKFAVN